MTIPDGVEKVLISETCVSHFGADVWGGYIGRDFPPVLYARLNALGEGSVVKYINTYCPFRSLAKYFEK